MSDVATPDPRALPAPVETGGRVELRLEASGATGAEGATEIRYLVRWILPDRTEEGVATVAPSGEISLAFDVGEPPAWLVDFTRSLLKTRARSASDEGWPRRLTRWRKAPEGR